MVESKDQKGSLYLIPTTLGSKNPLEVLPLSVKKVVEKVDYYIVENEKSARRFIKSVAPGKSQPKLTLYVLNKYTDAAELPNFLKPCEEGHSVGVLSEAGCPGIADPGADIVGLAHRFQIKVVPLVGPSSILLGMMASGLNGQNFAFNGYLPIDKSERRKAIKKLEKRSLDQNQAQCFIETPYRNNALLEDIVASVSPETSVCVACDLTLPSEFILTKPAKDWKNISVDLHKRPTLFILQKK